MKKLIAIPLLCGLLTGCDKAAEQQKQFEAASEAALSAPDPFEELDKFSEQVSDYASGCYDPSDYGGDQYSPKEACNRRLNVETKMVIASVNKGSVPALLFLMDQGPKNPPVYLRNLQADYAKSQIANFIELARAAKPVKDNTKLINRAAEVLQRGNLVTQDSGAAIALYKKAWLAGDDNAASRISDIYEFLGDTPRAYFWRIRAHSLPEGTANLKKLTSKDKLEIQRKAADLARLDI
ncbi:hypothetical protein CN027_22975 [Salmonella enterica subsp. enterica serovar Java]|nr:hypothetical protein [Salmonella enterica subsp. enterica serovar Java]